MSGLSRQEMKRDEVREWMVRAIDWIVDHGKVLLVALGGVVAVAAVVVVVLVVLGKRSERGQDELVEALDVWTAPINAEAAELEPESEDDPSFPSEEARRARAKELFEAIRSDFQGARAASIAAVYLGEIAAYEGDSDKARRLWSRFLAKEDDHILAAAVRLNLIALDRASGDQEALAAELREAIDGASGPVPIDVLLYELGRLLEDRGEEIEARDAFQQLVDEYPNSPYAGEARRRLDLVT